MYETIELLLKSIEISSYELATRNKTYSETWEIIDSIWSAVPTLEW